MTSLPPLSIVLEALREQVAPAVGAVLVLLGLFGRRWGGGAAVLAIAAGFALANVLSSFNPDWWPTERRVHWLPWLALSAALAGWLSRSDATPRLGQTLWVITLVMLVLRVLPKDYHVSPMWAVPLFVAVTAGNAYALERIADHLSRPLALFIAACVLLTSGTVVIFAHSKSLMDVANIGGMLFLALAGMAMLQRDGSPVLPAAAVLASGVLIAGYHETYSELPAATFALPLAAPVFASLGLMLARRWRRPVTLTLLLALVPLLAAVGLAFRYETLEFDV